MIEIPPGDDVPSLPRVAASPSRRRFAAATLGCAALVAVPLRAAADAYPSRAVRVLVGQAPGGPTDTIARMVAQAFTDRFGQSFVVENFGGAGGTIAARMVVSSPPDGYTLLLGSNASIASATVRNELATYDPVRDFAPVARVARVGYALAIGPSLNGNTLAELVAAVRARGTPLTLATVGPGSNSSHATVQFAKVAGIAVTDVPYKGGQPGLLAVIAGQVDGTFIDFALVQTHLAAGAVRVPATCGRKRLTLAPDIPTFAEAGFAGVVAEPWYGVVLPAGAPPPIVAQLNAALHAMLADPAVVRRFAALGYEPIVESPGQFAAAIREELENARAMAAGSAAAGK